MKKNFLHFLSTTPCILKINNEHIGEIDNKENLELDVLTSTSHIYLTYNPITTDTPSIPYTTLINTTTNPNSSNQNIKIIPFPNNHFDILLTPFYYYHTFESKTLYNHQIGNFFLSIIADDSNSQIILYSGMSIVYSMSATAFLSVKVSSHKEYILIQGITKEEKLYALVIDTKKLECCFNNYISSLEEDGENLTILQSCNTLCHHALVLNIQTNNSTTQKYYVFEKDNSLHTINPFFIPQAFFECLQIEDEKTLKSFLSTNFQSTNIQQFKEYFGNVKEFYFNRHTHSIHKVNYTIYSDSWHNYTFHMTDNLISEIEEIF